MNAVGIDVSKGKSMVAIMRPFGEIVSTPFEIKHTSSDINSLVKLIKSIEGESRIVMEHTGRYYEVLAHQLSEANLFVSAINPKLIKDFDNDSLRKVKTDKADSVKIARQRPEENGGLGGQYQPEGSTDLTDQRYHHDSYMDRLLSLQQHFHLCLPPDVCRP